MQRGDGETVLGEKQAFWLLGSEREVALGDYPTIVGRDGTCDWVVSDDPLVSRRHACFSTRDGVARVEDLNSRNGVYVDGARIEGAFELRGQETVRVGSLQLRLEVRQQLWPASAVNMAEPRKGSATADTLARGDDTDQANVFELLGGVAEKALKLGNTAEAVRVLRPALQLVLEEAERRGSLDPQSQLTALGFACRLAEASSDPHWLDYVFRLQTVLRRPPPAEVVNLLYRLVRRARPADLETLRQLVTTLSAHRASFGASEKFLVSRIEGLLRVATS